ncbi:hypothetical protein VKT23_016979 [Stygiomarasmius scandens]|uniref:Uncharacterized protein n=1 Tax=Marasmiellus scandens TaxID=2682957 RepID=A0ABR1IWU5_9AGAR
MSPVGSLRQPEENFCSASPSEDKNKLEQVVRVDLKAIQEWFERVEEVKEMATGSDPNPIVSMSAP